MLRDVLIPLSIILGLGAASAAGADSQIDRGKYLVTTGGCSHCHTPGSFFGRPDMARYLGGSDVGFAIPGLGVFVGLIVLIATREFILAGVALGIAFILSVVLMALFALAFKPNAAEVEDIHEQDVEAEEKAAGHGDAAKPGVARDGDERRGEDGTPRGH